MKQIISLVAFCAIGFGVFAQYSETRIIKDFDELRVMGPFDVELIEDQNNHQVLIESEEIDLHKIITEIDGNELNIRSAAAFTSKKKIKITVHYDVLREVSSSAGAIVFSNRIIYGDKIELKANSGGRMEFQLDMEKVELRATQGAKVYLEGKSKSTEVYCTTGASVEAANLKSKEVYIESSTGGIAEIHAEDKLDAHATTKGEILYAGSPSTLIDEVKLKGSIKKK